jgi:hypothetical protein
VITWIVNGKQKFPSINMKGDQAVAKKKIDILSLDILERVVDGRCQIFKTNAIKFSKGISQGFSA